MQADWLTSLRGAEPTCRGLFSRYWQATDSHGNGGKHAWRCATAVPVCGGSEHGCMPEMCWGAGPAHSAALPPGLTACRTHPAPPAAAPSPHGTAAQPTAPAGERAVQAIQGDLVILRSSRCTRGKRRTTGQPYARLPKHCKNNTRQPSSNVSQGVSDTGAGWKVEGAACLAGLYEHHEGRLLPQQLLQHQARGARLLVAACRGRCKQAEENCTRSGSPGQGRQLSGAGAPGQAAAAGAQGGARGQAAAAACNSCSTRAWVVQRGSNATTHTSAILGQPAGAAPASASSRLPGCLQSRQAQAERTLALRPALGRQVGLCPLIQLSDVLLAAVVLLVPHKHACRNQSTQNSSTLRGEAS